MKTRILIFLTLLFIASYSCNKKEQITKINKYDGAILKYEVVKVDSGWGYKIYKNNKVFINQPFIPAVRGTHYFKTKKDAELTAQLVIDIMSKKNGLPTVTIEQLDSIGVIDSTMIDEKKHYKDKKYNNQN